MRKFFVPLAAFLALLIIFPAGASAASNGSSCVSECTYPHDGQLHLYTSASPATAADAVSICNDFMTIRGSFWVTSGFILRWFGDSPPAAGQAGHFTCFACVDAEVPDPFGERLASGDDVGLDTATAIAVGLYGGEVASASRYFVDDLETGRAGASYVLRLVGAPELEGSAGMVEVEPFGGRVIRHHPVNCEER